MIYKLETTKIDGIVEYTLWRKRTLFLGLFHTWDLVAYSQQFETIKNSITEDNEKI
tara:strand:+ start:1102 stop:1269 length:168 start_codon:yes stop_codon:yes gene_type:complete